LNDVYSIYKNGYAHEEREVELADGRIVTFQCPLTCNIIKGGGWGLT
jgi:hypothetical protein